MPQSLIDGTDPAQEPNRFDGEGITTRLYNIISSLGIERIEDFSNYSELELILLPNCGEKTIREIKVLISTRGVCLKTDAERADSIFIQLSGHDSEMLQAWRKKQPIKYSLEKCLLLLTRQALGIGAWIDREHLELIAMDSTPPVAGHIKKIIQTIR